MANLTRSVAAALAIVGMSCSPEKSTEQSTSGSQAVSNSTIGGLELPNVRQGLFNALSERIRTNGLASCIGNSDSSMIMSIIRSPERNEILKEMGLTLTFGPAETFNPKQWNYLDGTSFIGVQESSGKTSIFWTEKTEDMYGYQRKGEYTLISSGSQLATSGLVTKDNQDDREAYFYSRVGYLSKYEDPHGKITNASQLFPEEPIKLNSQIELRSIVRDATGKVLFFEVGATVLGYDGSKEVYPGYLSAKGTFSIHHPNSTESKGDFPDKMHIIAGELPDLPLSKLDGSYSVNVGDDGMNGSEHSLSGYRRFTQLAGKTFSPKNSRLTDLIKTPVFP